MSFTSSLLTLTTNFPTTTPTLISPIMATTHLSKSHFISHCLHLSILSAISPSVHSFHRTLRYHTYIPLNLRPSLCTNDHPHHNYHHPAAFSVYHHHHSVPTTILITTPWRSFLSATTTTTTITSIAISRIDTDGIFFIMDTSGNAQIY